MALESSANALTKPSGFGQVVVVTGHMTDGPTRSVSRFPEHAVPAVRARIERTLTSWRFGAGDLLISGGARGADLIAASAARALGASVWLLLAVPPDVFERDSVATAGEPWVEQFRALVRSVPTWVLDAPIDDDDPDAVYVATNAWMLELATAQADGQPFRLLAVWDGLEAAGPGGAGDMVDAARKKGADVTIIDPGG